MGQALIGVSHKNKGSIILMILSLSIDCREYESS